METWNFLYLSLTISHWKGECFLQWIDESDTKKLEVCEYAVTSVGSFRYARHYQDRFPMIKNLYSSFKGTAKNLGYQLP